MKASLLPRALGELKSGTHTLFVAHVQDLSIYIYMLAMQNACDRMTLQELG